MLDGPHHARVLDTSREWRLLRVPLVDASAFEDERSEFVASLRFELFFDADEELADEDPTAIERREAAAASSPNTAADSVYCVNVFELHPTDVAERLHAAAKKSATSGTAPASEGRLEVVPFLRSNVFVNPSEEDDGANGFAGGAHLTKANKLQVAQEHDEEGAALASEHARIQQLALPASDTVSDSLCRDLTERAEHQNPAAMGVETPSTSESSAGTSGSTSTTSTSTNSMPRSPVSVAHHCVKVDELLVAEVVKSPSRSSAAHEHPGRTNGASLFEFAPRPRFTLGLNPSPAVACGGLKTARRSAVDPGIITRSTQQGRNLKMLGLLQYYPLPRVSFASRILQVPVRTFLNAGWGKRLPLACESCEPGGNYRVSMHILDPFLGCGTSAAATRYVAPASTQKRGAAAAGENHADGYVGVTGLDGAERDDLTGVLADADVERMKQENLRELHVGEEARATKASDLRPMFDVGRDWRQHCELKNPCRTLPVHHIIEYSSSPPASSSEGSAADDTPPADIMNSETSPAQESVEAKGNKLKELGWVLSPQVHLAKSATKALLGTGTQHSTTSRPAAAGTQQERSSGYVDLLNPPAWTKYGDAHYFFDGTTQAAGGTTATSSSQLLFPIHSTHRMQSSERRHYLHRRLAVCFEPDARYYPNVSILVGYATFHTSIADTQAFVLGIIFLIVLLPICCVVSMVLHRQKCINLARRHKSVRFWLERQRLQQELIAVRDMRDEMEQAGSPRSGGAAGGGGQE